MAEITLSDYAGFILLEIVKAREMADEYSREVAQRYAADEVMRYFPAPRFKMPKLDLALPILISGARFNQTVRFDFPAEDFVTFIADHARGVRVAVELARLRDKGLSDLELKDPPESRVVQDLAIDFHKQLVSNPEPRHPDTLVTLGWTAVVRACLEEADLAGFFARWDGARELLATTMAEVLSTVAERTVVDRTAIDSLLVNPVTNVVKNGSDDASVCTVHAELLEEGVYLRSVQDGEDGRTHAVVEFE
ncbi:hypothetical protein [Actinoplanes sp. NPDC049316]|uniref:hypothetical protein n=1 Tax=Actinoplanes sp. NPDC049316 TaxID=3154727 RepID=UPI00341388AB